MRIWWAQRRAVRLPPQTLRVNDGRADGLLGAPVGGDGGGSPRKRRKAPAPMSRKARRPARSRRGDQRVEQLLEQPRVDVMKQHPPPMITPEPSDPETFQTCLMRGLRGAPIDRSPSRTRCR